MRKPWSPLPSEESGFPPGCRSRSAPQRLGVCPVSGAGRSWEKRGLGGGTPQLAGRVLLAESLCAPCWFPSLSTGLVSVHSVAI